MKTLPISRYRFYQKLQPLSLLKKITSKSVTGCLQVFSDAGSWSIYVEEGKLIYACYSERMFEPLYRNLQRLSQQISTLPHGINQQVKTIFERCIENQAIPNPDYLAICWLVNEKYISSNQAAILIEQMSLEFLESFLKLQEGSYEFIPESFLDDLPKFCHLNLRLLVEQCQASAKVSTNISTNTGNLQFWQQGFQQPEANPEEQLQKQSSSNQATAVKLHRIHPQVTPKKNYTIFCIDDSPTALGTIKSFLDEQIFSVVGVTDSLRALMEIFSVKPDLILLDVTMPNLDGFELCSLLRKHAHFKHTPVIMVTDKSNLFDRAKAKLVKASGCLSKPFNQSDLLKTIFQHIV
jgi:chemotaxis family two-component system response regulator PixG